VIGGKQFHDPKKAFQIEKRLGTMKNSIGLLPASLSAMIVLFLLGVFPLQARELTPGQSTINLGAGLYAALKSQPGNLIFSPFSVLTAGALAQEGASGPTGQEMREVLSLNPDAAARRRDFAKWIGVINSPGKSFSLSTANNLWVQKGFSILPNYLQIAHEGYGAAVSNVDFTGDRNGSARTINDAVSKETAGTIPNLVSPDGITDKTRLILTNAVYFKGDWETPFKKESTDREDFHLTPGKTEPVSMMNQKVTAPLGDFKGVARVLALPYKGGEVSMYIFLPELGKMAGLEKALTEENLRAFWEVNSPDRTGLKAQKVMLSLPKFSFTAKYDLTQTLDQMGMPLAFTKPVSETGTGADFSGIDGKRDLYITDVVHQAYVAVDELGTTAAAATAIQFGLEMAMQEPPIPAFTVDHPFVFVIVEKSTNTMLFMGRVNDPLARN
jgi:serpin B